MSWLELDDGILDHPKFIRAAKLAGGDAVFLWLGIRAYCGQHLTDGFVPEDMLDEVRGPRDAERRAAALEALQTVGLLDAVEGGVQMHNYLKWSRSRDSVLESRRKNSERQAKARGHSVSNGVTDSVTRIATARVVTALVTTPSSSSSSIPLPIQESKSARGAPTSAHPDEQGTWDGSERETACPLDLEKRAKDLGIPTQLAESLKAEPDAILASVREFVGYWTIGAGMGQKRRHWMRKLREHVRKAAARPGGLDAPGALEHRERTRGGRQQEVSPNVDFESKQRLAASRRVQEFLVGLK